jgi:hypothetical protein
VTALVPPRYGQGSLSEVLPSVFSALGASLTDMGPGPPSFSLPAAPRACVLLVDGLGRELLAGAADSDAPFLRSLLPTGRVLDAGFPTSTPISLCSLGTGRTPGEHGIVGFTMHVPPVPYVMECLAWTSYGSGVDLSGIVPPETLQPCEPLFAAAARQGISSTVVSLAAHVGSGLTRAAFRGATFDAIRAFDDLDRRLELIVDRLERSDRALVYTYDARLDTAAHVDGVGSPSWRAALRLTDALAAAIADRLPRRTLLLVTGDHGAINVPGEERIDLADRAELARDVEWLSGDPRTRHAHAAPGRAKAVGDAWRTGLGDGWVVLGRRDAIDSGLFGPVVSDDVGERIGDVVAVAIGRGGLFDRARFPWELRLAGFHGALTPPELEVPLLFIEA